MRKLVTLTKALVGEQPLMLSNCRNWYTNGHWAIRAPLTKTCKTTPKLAEERPNVDAWAATLTRGATTRQAQVEKILELQSSYAIRSEGRIVAWADKDYFVRLEGLGELWACGDGRPLMFGPTDRPGLASAWLMPTQPNQLCLELLSAWCNSQLKEKKCR